MLFDRVPIDTIISIFTHLLCLEKLIIVAETQKELVPIWMALHSLIYPFKYELGVPYQKDDLQEDDSNDLITICAPFPIFAGIIKQDKETLKRVI